MDNSLHLPTEIITDIFEYLHHDELQTVSMTCKYWYNSKFLTKTFKLHNVFIICKENLKYIPSMNANLFHNIKIRNLSKSEQIQLCEYLNDFEGIIKTCHITLEDLEVYDASTLLILKKLCTNGTLKSIELDCCTKDLLTNHINELIHILRKVKNFSINLAKLSSDLSMGKNMEKKLIELISNLENIVYLKFLVNERENIRISEVLNDLTKDLKSLEICHPKLYIQGAQFVTYKFYSFFEENSHRLNNLTQLSMWQTVITDNFFEIISKNIKKLQTLELVKCHGEIDSSDIICLKDLKCLKALNLNDFKNKGILFNILRDELSCGLEFGIFEKCNENLEEIKLNSLHLTESCVVKISSMPNLRILELKDNPGVTNDTLQSIIFNCRWLRSLNLSLNRISDDGVSKLISISELKGLRKLEMVKCNITDEVLKEHFRFLELRRINLRQCTKITKKGVQLMLKNCPSLKEVLFN